MSKQSHTDLSVINEMASRLHAAGLWDNNLGDGVTLLKCRIETLDRFCRYERWAYERVGRPLESWKDCRRLLVIIALSRAKTFTNIPAPIEACLTLAVLLEKWRKERHAIPVDIRGMMHGAIAVEWPGGESLILDGKR